MPKNLFTDYEGFVEKFKPKKTTDDCYTPEWLYDLVVDYVNRRVRPLEGLNIVRPFWPGGDYESYDYQPNDVVIDNPPFSIISKICQFYKHVGVPFFLFAPALSLGDLAKDDFTAIVAQARVTYTNGAKICTSFVTNMMPDTAIVVDGEFSKLIADNNKKVRVEEGNTTVMEYPSEVVTAARLQTLLKGGKVTTIARDEARFLRNLDYLRAKKSGIYGGGWIVSRDAAARIAAAREDAARAAAREDAAREEAAREVVKITLSPAEQACVDWLSSKNK